LLLCLWSHPVDSPAALSWVFGRSFLPEPQALQRHRDVDDAGRLVNLGSHSLFLNCRGSGGPTVVVDTALGSAALEWRHIQSGLARAMRVCLYDRAGYGESEPGPLPRTTGRLARELHELLNQAGEAGPYVLVGHSFGGYTAQHFASRYPESVAGIVLVDSSHPDQYERFLAPPLNVRTAPGVDRPGFHLFRFATPRLHPNLPAEVREEAGNALLRLPTRTAIAEEFYSFRRSAMEVRESGPLPDVPLLVISRGTCDCLADHRSRLFEARWLELQIELSGLTPHSAHIVAERSGHYVHLDRPQLVIDGISLVVDLARLRVAGVRRSAPVPWYAFDGATWLVDGFGTLVVPGPVHTSQNGYRSPGRSADPTMVAWMPR
jgi:pimeloyl-ACP methyl ester carboxylesterase